MTDQTTAELIATARAMREQTGEEPKPGSILALWFETADTLEASEKRAEELKRILNNMRDLATVYGKGWDAAEQRAEAAERERDNWKLSAEEAERAEKRWKDRADEAERSRNALGDGYRAQVTKTAEAVHELWAVAKERDQLAAVVEKVRELPRYRVPDPVMEWGAVDSDDLDHALSSAPADLLREVKAEVWREGVAAIDPDATDIVAALDPYRDEEQP